MDEEQSKCDRRLCRTPKVLFIALLFLTDFRERNPWCLLLAAPLPARPRVSCVIPTGAVSQARAGLLVATAPTAQSRAWGVSSGSPRGETQEAEEQTRARCTLVHFVRKTGSFVSSLFFPFRISVFGVILRKSFSTRNTYTHVN